MREIIDPESEHGGIISGQIRDFTRRYGLVQPSSEFSGYVEDKAGNLYEAVDDSSVTAILFSGLRRINRPEIPPKTSSDHDISE